MKHYTVVLIAVTVVTAGWIVDASTASFGARWRGTLALAPAFELTYSRVSLNSRIVNWTVRLELDVRGGALRDVLSVVRGRAGAWNIEARAAFAPTPRQLLGLQRTWRGEVYPQVIWETPAPHLRYAWIRCDVPLGDGALSLRLHHRVHHGWDVTNLGYTEALRWDTTTQRWEVAHRQLASASQHAIVARGLRVVRANGGTYTDRFSLAMEFDPTDHDEPLSPAAAARSYLDARVGPGWTLDEVFIEDALVYLQRPYRTELRLRWDVDLGFGDLRLTNFWEDGGDGIAWWKTEGWLRGIRLPQDATGALNWSLERAAPPRGFWEMCGWRLWGPLSWGAQLEWGVRGGNLELALDWEDEGQVTAHVRPVWYGRRAAFRLDGISIAFASERPWTTYALVAFTRPPAPRPAWYRSAAFRRVHGTGRWEDGLWVFSVDGGAGSLDCAVYTATQGDDLLAVTRLRVEVGLTVSSLVKLEITWVSDDPAVAGRAPSWEFGWDLSV